MKSRRTIENQLEHFRNHCTGDPALNAVWVQALEWVLADPQLRKELTARDLLEGAAHVLRSYQYGNSSPELAENGAEVIEAWLRQNPPEPDPETQRVT